MMAKKSENTEKNTEHSGLFDIFQGIQYENQEKRYEATIEILDEFHRRLYAKNESESERQELEKFRKYFIKKYAFTETKSKDATVRKIDDNNADNSDRWIISDSKQIVSSNQGEEDDNTKNRSPTGSQSSDSEMYDFGSAAPSISLVQVKDESVKQFLQKSFADNRQGAHDYFAADFFNRKHAKSAKKNAVQKIKKLAIRQDEKVPIFDDVPESLKPGPSK